jgi:hypothetical protein
MGTNMAHMSGFVIWFHHCDVANWTIKVVEDLVEGIAYDGSEDKGTLFTNDSRGIGKWFDGYNYTDTETESMVLFLSLMPTICVYQFVETPSV